MWIDFFGDLSCPWSHLGWRRLLRALTDRNLNTNVLHWRPFQLNPDIPVTGINRSDYLVQKFGNLERVHEVETAIMATMQTDNLAINLDRIGVTPHTALAHRLMLLAEAQGKSDTFMNRIFSAYFVEGQNISDPDLLNSLAKKEDLPAALVISELNRTMPHPIMQESELEARQIGIKAVPYAVFDKQYSIAGAHDPVAFLPLIDLCLLNPQPETVSVMP
jgi:predicted DsbA family dithiol-disulfide isomerase